MPVGSDTVRIDLWLFSPFFQHPGLHLKSCDQQVEGGDSPCLLCPFETPAGVLCLGVECSEQEGCESVGAGPEEGCDND